MRPKMRDYVHNFRFMSTEDLQARVANKKLHPKAADACRQVLDERARHVPVDIRGTIWVSGHSGCYYVTPDADQEVPMLFEGQRDGDCLIRGELAGEHDLQDRQRIVFRMEPNMSFVSEIVEVGEVVGEEEE